MAIPTVKLRPLAESDLVEIFRHTNRQWGQAKAHSYIRDFHQSFLRLTEHPATGQDRSDIKPGLRSFNQGSHVIFYRKSVSGVLIVRVLHQAMDVERHF